MKRSRTFCIEQRSCCSPIKICVDELEIVTSCDQDDNKVVELGGTSATEVTSVLTISYEDGANAFNETHPVTWTDSGPMPQSFIIAPTVTKVLCLLTFENTCMPFQRLLTFQDCVCPLVPFDTLYSPSDVVLQTRYISKTVTNQIAIFSGSFAPTPDAIGISDPSVGLFSNAGLFLGLTPLDIPPPLVVNTNVFMGMIVDVSNRYLSYGFTLDSDSGFYYMFIMRHLADGTLDPGFNLNGYHIGTVPITVATDATIAPSGEIYVGGVGDFIGPLPQRAVVWKFTDAGLLDTANFNSPLGYKIFTEEEVATSSIKFHAGTLLVGGSAFVLSVLLDGTGLDLAYAGGTGYATLPNKQILHMDVASTGQTYVVGRDDSGIAFISSLSVTGLLEEELIFNDFPIGDFLAVDIDALDRPVVGGAVGDSEINSFGIVLRFTADLVPDISFRPNGYLTILNQLFFTVAADECRILAGGIHVLGEAPQQFFGYVDEPLAPPILLKTENSVSKKGVINTRIVDSLFQNSKKKMSTKIIG